MSSPDLVDIEALLAPIPGDQPAGSGLPFDVRQQLEEGRKEEDPDSFAADDPMRPHEFKKADWRGIIRLAQDTLTRTSKDLQVAARLTEALVKAHGFAGLRDGFRLLRGLVEECWDRLHPPLEDGEVEIRASPFVWLDNPIRGITFPITLRQVPLLVIKDASYALQQCDQSEQNKARVPQSELDKAIRKASREQLAAVSEDVTECLAELDRLRASLDARMGAHAPGLTEVGKVLESCQLFLQHALRECPVPAAKADNPSGDERASAGTKNSSSGDRYALTDNSGAQATRAEAYRQLAQAAARLQELEPHSPIPYLVQRAVELGSLPFPQLMKALIRDVNVLTELNREFGIKESSPEAPAE
jgi:type VI secretion system protein ImpA